MEDDLDVTGGQLRVHRVPHQLAESLSTLTGSGRAPGRRRNLAPAAGAPIRDRAGHRRGHP
ncbi:hypothetical protein ACOJVU_08660 [Mycobacterium sp. THU-M104]|uniref:hypothetical protein n=1 Tax=Mycobacterium sp. THU-M104 TaxID=3410515 RepID=UPI003B9ADF62